MFSPQQTGKLIGSLMIIQVVVGIYINFFVMGALFRDSGFLENGALMSTQVGASFLLGLGLGFANLIIAGLCHRVFSQFNPFLTIFLVAVAAVNLAVSVVEYAKVMEMVSYSQLYVNAVNDDVKAMLLEFKPVVAESRNWIHFFGVTMSGIFLFSFYLLLLRGSSVSRFVSGTALLAVVIQIAAVTQPFLGNSVPMAMLAPLALCQFTFPVYFFFKGIGSKATHGESSFKEITA